MSISQKISEVIEAGKFKKFLKALKINPKDSRVPLALYHWASGRRDLVENVLLDNLFNRKQRRKAGCRIPSSDFKCTTPASITRKVA